jgi:hypothetical protein
MFDPETLINVVVRGFDFAKTTHVFGPEETQGYVRALLGDAIDLAMQNPNEYIEVRVDEWVAQALYVPDMDEALASLMFVTEYSTARYMEGNYV